jgi:hypothetical protein
MVDRDLADTRLGNIKDEPPGRDRPYPRGSRYFSRMNRSQLLTRRVSLNLGLLYVFEAT